MALQNEIGYITRDENDKEIKKPFRTTNNNKYFPKNYIKTENPSMTVPGASFTVKELLEKHVTGMMPPVAKQAIYSDNPTYDDIDVTKLPDFDLVDASDMITAIEDKITEAKNKIVVDTPDKPVNEEVTPHLEPKPDEETKP